MRVTNYYKKICSLLERLHKLHPSYNMGKHLSTALDESNLWGMSDKEIYTALNNYSEELLLDKEHPKEDLEMIIKGGMNLDEDIYEEEED